MIPSAYLWDPNSKTLGEQEEAESLAPDRHMEHVRNA